MSDIKEFLTQGHRDCDELFAELEDAVAKNSDESSHKYEKFYDDLTNHFSMEEMVLFPMLNDYTPNSPLRAMEMEHEQLRELLSKMRKALEQKDKEKFFSLSETLMILMQQHNMKEEQMLYTMAQQRLSAESDRIVDMMKSMVVEA